MALEGEVFRYHRSLISLPDSPEGYPPISQGLQASLLNVSM